MKKIFTYLEENLEEILMVILLGAIALVIFAQVIARLFDKGFPWAEEFCRFCWIGSVFLSLPYTIRNVSMHRVCVLMDLLPQKVHKIINILVYFVTAACMALLAWHSVGVVAYMMKSGEMSPAMRWPMWAVYSTMLAGFVLGTLRGIQQGILHIRRFGERELTTLEQTMQDAATEAAAGKRAEGGVV